MAMKRNKTGKEEIGSLNEEPARCCIRTGSLAAIRFGNKSWQQIINLAGG
jgi:hypothetical protein